MGGYQTVGKEKLLRFLSERPDCQFTVEEICLGVNGNEKRGRSSIYRQLTGLCGADAVRRFRNGENGRSVYQYVGEVCDCRHHFHAKCLRCGALEHLDCGDSVEFANHLLDEHGFRVDCSQSVLYGLCAACAAKEKRT